jgi:hypothetical protein
VSYNTEDELAELLAENKEIKRELLSSLSTLSTLLERLASIVNRIEED